MAPSKTATRQPYSYPGVSHVSDPRHKLAPWLVTVYHNGTRTRSFHGTFEEAVKIKQKAERLQKKEGSRAFSYDRGAQVEYEEAKRLVGDTPLPLIAKEFAARYAADAERKTVREAVAHYVDTKTKLNRSEKHIGDIRQRLKRFEATFPDRGIETITRNELLDWLTKLELGPRSIWNFFGVLEALFNYAENRDWLTVNPLRKIDRSVDLPSRTKGPVTILTPEQGVAFMRKVEKTEPTYIAWACLQYFVGVRDAESGRFRGEWIERKAKRVVVPGWFYDRNKSTPPKGISKTRDDWVINDVPPAFWEWVDRYPKTFAPGPIRAPQWMAWERIRDALIADGVFEEWPHNGLRHSIATYHLSAYSDQGRTSLMLRHQNSKKLWTNYMAKLVSKKIGLRYLDLRPAP